MAKRHEHCTDEELAELVSQGNIECEAVLVSRFWDKAKVTAATWNISWLDREDIESLALTCIILAARKYDKSHRVKFRSWYDRFVKERLVDAKRHHYAKMRVPELAPISLSGSLDFAGHGDDGSGESDERAFIQSFASRDAASYRTEKRDELGSRVNWACWTIASVAYELQLGATTDSAADSVGLEPWVVRGIRTWTDERISGLVCASVIGIVTSIFADVGHGFSEMEILDRNSVERAFLKSVMTVVRLRGEFISHEGI